jgi:hypothetical protein
MDINHEQECKLCGGEFSVQGILSLAEYYWPELDVLVCKSPCCQKSEELQLKAGVVERGYVYAAGSAHFAGMELYKAPNLKVSKSSQAITFNLSGSEVTVSAKT